MAHLNAAIAKHHPRLICRAEVPCAPPVPAYIGHGCGFPVTEGPAYRFLLDSGQWVD